MIAYLPCKQPTRKRLCYTGPIAYPKSWYDRLLRPTSGAIYKKQLGRLPQEQYDRLPRPTSRHLQIYNSVAYPKSCTIDYFAPRAAQSLQQLGRLPQERYNRLLHHKSGTITPTTQSPTPRAVQLTTSSQEWYNHSNNSVAYPKSGTIDYFITRAVQSLQQLGRLPQERYNRLLHPKSGTITPTTRSPTPRMEQLTTSPQQRDNQTITRPPTQRAVRPTISP
jgi:hypothetical protein